MRRNVHWPLVRNTARYYWRHRRWKALARAMWHTVVLDHHSELCQECGGRYGGLVWWAPQPLWDALMPSYGGLLCPRCFTRKAAAAGYRLMWTPMVKSVGGVPTTNHWCDETRDALMMGEPDPGYFPDGKVRQPQPTWALVKTVYATGLPSEYPDENRVGEGR